MDVDGHVDAYAGIDARIDGDVVEMMLMLLIMLILKVIVFSLISFIRTYKNG